MPLVGKTFYNDYLPSTAGDLYTVAAGKVAYLSYGWLKNMAATTEAAKVMLKNVDTGVETELTPGYGAGLLQNESDDFVAKTLTIQGGASGAKLRGVTTNASAVKCILSGAEE